ncbi:MAG: MFS transporter [Gammaproteobacteria bacterium]|nr:MFS transporter [Gammaproteobacteria bacterium]MBT4495005.1 MFS transporter [Gammaproteobacteria bacterium]
MSPLTPEEPSGRVYNKVGGVYAWYALGILTLVQGFNFLDRQIVAILAEEIKADLMITDAQIGFLYGTAFAIFHIIFIVPAAKLADTWERRKLASLSLAIWSMLTAVCGFAKSFPQLAIARFGVGIGETAAGPCCHSMISDYFPREKRATAMSIFVAGTSIGGGAGILIGGYVVEGWKAMFPAGTEPFGIKAWQAAFLAVGFPGLLLAILVYLLKEPIRGLSDGRVAKPPAQKPWPAFLEELSWIIPPLSLIRIGSLGKAHFRQNLTAGGVILVLTLLAIYITGDYAQWISLAAGFYVIFTWAQSLMHRDAPAFAIMFRTPSFVLTVAGFTCIAFSRFGVTFWTPAFFMRFHDMSVGEVATLVGTVSVFAGIAGDVVGGVWADHWKKTNNGGRLLVGVFAAGVPIPLIVWMLYTDQTYVAAALLAPIMLCGAMFTGPGASTVQDLVLPRMRGTGAAVLILSLNLIGLGIGPYLVGRISDSVGDLRMGMMLSILVSMGAIVCFLVAARRIGIDESSRWDRAQQYGEVS